MTTISSRWLVGNCEPQQPVRWPQGLERQRRIRSSRSSCWWQRKSVSSQGEFILTWCNLTLQLELTLNLVFIHTLAFFFSTSPLRPTPLLLCNPSIPPPSPLHHHIHSVICFGTTAVRKRRQVQGDLKEVEDTDSRREGGAWPTGPEGLPAKHSMNGCVCRWAGFSVKRSWCLGGERGEGDDEMWA